MRKIGLSLLMVAGCAASGSENEAIEAKASALSQIEVSVVPRLTPLPSVLLSAPPATKTKERSSPDCGATTFVWAGPTKITSCPDIPSVKGGKFIPEPVFAEAPLPELRRYCAFTWSPSFPTAPPDVAGLSAALSQWNSERPEPDCAVVAPQTPPIDALAEGFEKQFITQNTQVSPDLAQRSPVRVAVIDSAIKPYPAVGTGSYDRYGHGRLIGRIIHRLACPSDDAGCSVDIQNELALPQISRTLRDPVNGGFYGTRVDLARAIHRALLVWGNSEKSLGAKAAPLVLNLSVAWEPAFGGAEEGPSGFSAPTRLVYLALERASCLGVATIAAMGNRAGDSRSHPMLPAAWSRFAAPDAERCKAITGLAADAPGRMRPPTSGRLLEASAGVDLYDRALTNSRLQATPRLVSYGQAAVLTDPRTARTDVLTGSSISTAVLSAAVAAVWSVAPSYSASAVLDLIYEQGVGLGRTVEPCGGAGCIEVKRVSVCEAARKAQCLTGACAFDAPCGTVSAFAGTAVVAGLWFDPADYPPSAATSCTGAACDSGGPSYGEAPWVGPQPGTQPCPYCVVDLYWGRVILTLPPLLSGASSLEIALDNGNTYGVTGASGGFPQSLSVSGLDTLGAHAANLRAVIGIGSDARVSETPLFAY